MVTSVRPTTVAAHHRLVVKPILPFLPPIGTVCAQLDSLATESDRTVVFVCLGTVHLNPVPTTHASTQVPACPIMVACTACVQAAFLGHSAKNR